MRKVAILNWKFAFVYAINVYTFGRIFVKLTQFIYLINSFNPIDFQKNWKISMGKVAILSWKFEFLIYTIKSTFLVRFSWNLHSVSISSIPSTLLIFKKNWTISLGKVAILSWKFAFPVYMIKSTFLVGFSWNLQFVHLINSSNPIDFEKNRTIRKGKVAILIWKICISPYSIQSAFMVGFFVKLAQFVFIINSLNRIDFEKKSNNQ